MANTAPGVNPYAGPKATVAEPAEQYQPVKVFSVSGRIGRARFFTYAVGLNILCGILGGLLSLGIGDAGNMVGGLAFLVLAFMLAIQRCHDFNTTGWLSLLVLLPIVNLIFLFIPGTKGPNRFGAQTPPNTILTLVLVWLLPLLFIGIVAAVAIPAFQGYQKRALETQQQKR